MQCLRQLLQRQRHPPFRLATCGREPAAPRLAQRHPLATQLHHRRAPAPSPLPPRLSGWRVPRARAQPVLCCRLRAADVNAIAVDGPPQSQPASNHDLQNSRGSATAVCFHSCHCLTGHTGTTTDVRCTSRPCGGIGSGACCHLSLAVHCVPAIQRAGNCPMAGIQRYRGKHRWLARLPARSAAGSGHCKAPGITRGGTGCETCNQADAQGAPSHAHEAASTQRRAGSTESTERLQ